MCSMGYRLNLRLYWPLLRTRFVMSRYLDTPRWHRSLHKIHFVFLYSLSVSYSTPLPLCICQLSISFSSCTSRPSCWFPCESLTRRKSSSTLFSTLCSPATRGCRPITGLVISAHLGTMFRTSSFLLGYWLRYFCWLLYLRSKEIVPSLRRQMILSQTLPVRAASIQNYTQGTVHRGSDRSPAHIPHLTLNNYRKSQMDRVKSYFVPPLRLPN